MSTERRLHFETELAQVPDRHTLRIRVEGLPDAWVPVALDRMLDTAPLLATAGACDFMSELRARWSYLLQEVDGNVEAPEFDEDFEFLPEYAYELPAAHVA